MKFSEVVAQTLAWLQREERVSYRALKLEFDLNEDVLDALKEELIEAKRVAVDENGKVLVWAGKGGKSEKERDSEPRTSHSELISAERRQLTVMFCDLVGSTALSEQLDPEELREVVRAYQETCTDVVRRYDGHIAQHLGDGLLIYFSYPTAHEDDAARAVRTGLEIVEQLQSRARQQAGNASLPHGRGSDSLHVRIGIHTGLVVIGEIGSSEKREILALGETPNLAARLQGLAEPDTVVISAVTQRLVAGLFTVSDLGLHTLKGISTPLEVHQVLSESGLQSRFEVAVRAGLTPLVGREHEMGLLQERWVQASQGAGQVVLLSGEPGIGKSRLVQAIKEHASAEGAARIELRCSPYHQNSAFYPIIEHLQRVLQFSRDDAPEEKLQKLEQRLSRSPLDLQETVPLFASLLSLPAPRSLLPALSPQKQKQKTQEALVAWLMEEAARQAVYCAWEDLHWADPSSLEVLSFLLEQIPTTRLLAVLTFRPEFTPPWRPRSHMTHLTLNRLGSRQVEEMVEKVTGSQVLSAEVLQQIVSKTDGIPLFVEELTKSVVEATRGQVTGDGGQEGKFGGAQHAASAPLTIPATLHDSLMARLDRLGTAKGVAQMGATLGREFSYELLQAVSLLNEETLQHELKQLVEAELVYQHGLPPQATYLFKHVLVQDAAYQSLLKSTRRQYHRQIAQVLEEQFLETKDNQPELLAHHYTEARMIEQAIPYWQKAGERASGRSAYMEAVAHFTTGLEVLKALPDTPKRVQQELTLQLALNDALVAVKGYAAPEVEKAVTRARELCQQLGETPQLFPVQYRLWTFYFIRGELQTARELAEQCFSLAQSIQDRYLLSGAHAALGITLSLLGKLTSARPHLEQAIALYDPQQHPRTTVGTVDLRVECLSFVAYALWRLGYPDQGLKRSHEALALAAGLSHPFSLAFALGHAALFHLLRREGQLARERAEVAMTLSTEQGFPFWLAFGRMVRDWALAEQGQIEEGPVQMHQGLTAWGAMGAGNGWPWSLAGLAEAYGKMGQSEEGLTLLAEALALVDKTGERVGEAELYRLKGTLTLQQFNVQGSKFKVTDPHSLTPDPQAKAEACFLKAIEIARRQSAKSLELRAVMSLARLWQQQGKQGEAHKLLSEIYNWFTEGFDTKDLQEAKALLDELAEG